MKYKFIINENASTGRVKKAIPELINIINSNFKGSSYSITSDLSQVQQIIGDCPDCDVIVAVGGDGTINGVLNNIIDPNKTLGIIPFGSGNDFPMMINIPKEIHSAFEILKTGKVKNIDVGRLRTEKYEKYFLNAVGIGFDAKVGFHTNRIRFLRGGLSKYIVSLLYSLFTYKTPQMSIAFNGNPRIDKKCFLVTVGNGKSTGGGFLITPDANIEDGVFDICIVDDVSILTVLRVFPRVLKGGHTNLPVVKMLRSNGIEVQSASELYLHYDGETPEMVKNIHLEIMPQKQKIICN